MGAPKPSTNTSQAKECTKSNEGETVRQNQLSYAKEKYEEYFVESSIADNSSKFPTFAFSNLTLGKILGKGGFGTVWEVKGVKTDSKTASDEGQFIADHCVREDSGDARYAIKMLSEENVKNPTLFVQGTLDMAIETRVLSDTEHPNIIKARALAIVDPFSDNYFIMMDRLYDTMEGRIKKWQKLAKFLSGIGGKVFDRQGERKKELWDNRIMAAFDLSDALGYLHRKKIVYRDLKPENIGFDIRDDVKLFDFGLAGELAESKKMKDGLYCLTGMTGSPRYMAPEVANFKNYNEKCDVYSFAVLAWEMLALKTPYELFTMTKLRTRVWNGEDKRPFLNTTWPKPIQIMLKRSWSKEINIRPSFSEITETLRKQCIEARGGNEEGLEHSRRRSTFVFAKLNLEKLNISEAFSMKSFSRKSSVQLDDQ